MKIKSMLRVWCVLLCAAFMLTLCGCAGETGGGTQNGLSVVATIFPPYDFTRQVAGDKVSLQMLLKPGAESHSYDPTPQDIIAIQNCDVFIYVGGESDSWLDSILKNIDPEKTALISLMDTVQVLQEEHTAGMQVESGEAHTEEYDEHVWTSVENACLITQKICDVLCGKDAANAEFYRGNTDDYLAKLGQLDEAFRQVTAGAKTDTLVFADRFPLLYFVKEYGLQYEAAFPGCSSSTEANASTIAYLIDLVKARNIPVIFKIELSNGNIADTVSAATGAKVLTFYSCHNISKDDFQAGETYLSLMQKNVDSLKEALGT